MKPIKISELPSNEIHHIVGRLNELINLRYIRDTVEGIFEDGVDLVEIETTSEYDDEGGYYDVINDFRIYKNSKPAKLDFTKPALIEIINNTESKLMAKPGFDIEKFSYFNYRYACAYECDLENDPIAAYNNNDMIDLKVEIQESVRIFIDDHIEANQGCYKLDDDVKVDDILIMKEE